jgi:hypothetical protein
MATSLFRVGSAAFEVGTSVVHLHGDVLGITYQSLMLAGGAHYQVGATHTLIICQLHVLTQAIHCRFAIGYGTAAVDASAAPPAGDVRLTSYYGLENIVTDYEYKVWLPVPPNMYPYIYGAQASEIDLNIFGVVL